MLCLGDGLQPEPCADPARFDVLTVHPISQGAGPRVQATLADDIAIADLPTVKRTLRAAEQHGMIVGTGHPVWVSEYWWQTRPPREDPAYPTPGQQARWIAEAQMDLWKFAVPVGIMYSLRDQPYLPSGPSVQGGLYYVDGRPKPSLAAARFPLAGRRSSAATVDVWTRPPADGLLTIERKVAGEWVSVSTLAATAGEPISQAIPMPDTGLLRAVVAGETSYVYEQRR